MVDKQRCIIITHPSFQGGIEAINEAKDFAKSLQTVITSSEQFAGLPADQREALTAHLSQFRLLVRKLPKDIL